ncbi:hypothetical protein EDD17DRAFT_1762219 [Pisolithus thermaeus]|nr:hypothetical protein EDD17DRAFT_1762219 [Pisolithus thermaeus]
MSWSTIPVTVDDGFPRDTVPEMWAKTTSALEEVLRNIPAARNSGSPFRTLEPRSWPLTAPSEVQTGHIPPKRCVGQKEEPSAVATSSKHDEGKEMSHHGDNKIPRSQVDKHTRKDGSGRNEGNPDSADVPCERECESASKVERKRKGPAAPPSLSLTTKRPKLTPPLAASSLPQSSKLTLRLKRRSTSRMVSQGNVPEISTTNSVEQSSLPTPRPISPAPSAPVLPLFLPSSTPTTPNAPQRALTPVHPHDIERNRFYFNLQTLLQGPIPRSMTEHPKNMATGDSQEPEGVEEKPQLLTALDRRIDSLEKRISEGEREVESIYTAAARITANASRLGDILGEAREVLEAIREVRAEYPN